MLVGAALLTTAATVFVANTNHADAQNTAAKYEVDIKPQWNDKGELLQPADFNI